MTAIPINISFDKIPSTIRTPGTFMEVNNSMARAGLPGIWYRILVIGQMLPSGQQPALTPLLITGGKAQADAAFGQGSMLSAMVTAAKAANPNTEMWAIGVVDNPAGAVAAGAVTFTGTATAAGTDPLYLGGTLIQTGITANMTAAQSATALAAAINANPDLQVTAAVDGVNTSKVNITARHKGEASNYIDIRTLYYSGDAVPAGLTVAVTPMSGGTANPSLTPVIAALSDDWYHAFICPYTDQASTAAISNEMERRFGPLVQHDGMAYSAASGTVGTLATLGQALDGEHLSIFGLQGCPTPPYILAAVYGAVAAFNLSIDPARPLQTLALPGVMAPASADQFKRSDRDLLYHDGIASARIGTDGTVMIDRAVTTYQTNAAGLPDASYLDVETMATICYVRYSWRQWMAQKFPRHKLADDGTTYPAGQAIVTPKIIAAEQVAWFQALMDLGLVEDLAQFKADQLVARNQGDASRVDTLVPAHLVSGLRVLAGQLRFLL